jgi:hypothetical protein
MGWISFASDSNELIHDTNMSTKRIKQTPPPIQTNDTNNTAKRTARQVAAALRAQGVEASPVNQGDGRTFYVAGSGLKNRVAIAKAGFILERSAQGAPGVYFRAF